MNSLLARWPVGVLLVALAMAGPARAAYIDHNLDAAPFTNGATFVTPVLQWQDPAGVVTVVSGVYASAFQSVRIPSSASLSNAVAVASPQTVWTEVRLLPAWGDPPDTDPAASVAVATYFASNGYLNVWNGSAWLTCSQDVWGVSVGAVNTGVWTAVAIYQNFSNHTAAVLVNDRVVAQDLPFTSSITAYGMVRLRGADADSWLDDAYVSNTCAQSRHSADSNGVSDVDAVELQTYGYVARTLYAGTGSGYPRFATIQAAANAWRPRDTVYVYAGQYAEDVTVTNNLTLGGQSFTNSGSLTIGTGVTVSVQAASVWSNAVTVGTNATATFSQALTCSNLTIRAGATVTCASVTCSNLVVEPGAHFICSGPFQCSGACTFNSGAVATFSSSAACAGSFTVASGATVTLSQGATLGSLAVAGALTVGTGYTVTVNSITLNNGAPLTVGGSLVCSNLVVVSGTTVTVANVTCSNLVVQSNAVLNCQSNGLLTCSLSLTCTGLVGVASGAVVTATGALALPPGGHLDFSQGHFVYSPLAVDMTGSFSLSNNWGQANGVTVSPYAGCVFSQSLTNPPLGTLYLSVGSTSTFQSVTCTNLTAEDAVHATFLGALACVNGLTWGQTGVAVFSNTVTAGTTLEIGTNTTATFSQALTCSNLTIRAGATVTCTSVTCSNLVVEPGAHFTCTGAFQCSGVSTVDAGATVSLNQGGTLGTLNATGTVTLAAGQLLTIGSATIYGSVLVSGASTVTVTTALSVPTNGTGYLDFTCGRFVVPGSGVDMTGTFRIDNTWGAQATIPLDFSDNFELYAVNTRATALGFRGWGATDTGVVVRTLQGVSNSQALAMSEGSAVSNRVLGAGATKVWADVYVRPTLGEPPDAASTNGHAFLGYCDSNGCLYVWSDGQWSVCSNAVNGSSVTALSTNACTRITVFLNYSTHQSAVFVGDKVVREMLPFPGGATVPQFNNLLAQCRDGGAALDNVRVATTPPTDLLVVNSNTDLNGDGIADAAVIHSIGTIWIPGSVFTFR